MTAMMARGFVPVAPADAETTPVGDGAEKSRAAEADAAPGSGPVVGSNSPDPSARTIRDGVIDGATSGDATVAGTSGWHGATPAGMWHLLDSVGAAGRG